jgi:uncharacterized protein
MQIQLETSDNITIQSYGDDHITIENTEYKQSVIVSAQTIIPHWSIQSIQSLTESSVEPFLELKPDVIIIGHQGSMASFPLSIAAYLSSKRIGIECMSIGAACRTFNVLVSEQRAVVAGFIFTDSALFHVK